MANISAQNIVYNISESHKKETYTPALISLGILYFMLGFITCLNDTLVPFFKKGFELTYAESSLVQFYFFLTYGLMSIPAGKIVERTGYQKGMVLGFFIASIGAILFFPASAFHEYYLFISALFILAIGIVLLQVAANPFIILLGSPATASSRMTMIQGVGSIGTTIAPLFGAYFILSRLEASASPGESVRYPYLGIAVLLLLIALFVFLLKLPHIKTGSGTGSKMFALSKDIFSFRQLNFGIIGIFAYVGAEVSIGTFLTNYISDTLNIPEKSANNYVAFYWGGMLLCRILGSFVLKHIKPPIVLAVGALLAILCILVSVNATGFPAVWFMIAVGLCNSVMFAIIFSLAVNGLDKFTTQASGLLSTAIIGGAIISYLVGVIKDYGSWDLAFMIPVLCYLYLLFYGINGYKPNSQKISYAV